MQPFISRSLTISVADTSQLYCGFLMGRACTILGLMMSFLGLRPRKYISNPRMVQQIAKVLQQASWTKENHNWFIVLEQRGMACWGGKIIICGKSIVVSTVLLACCKTFVICCTMYPLRSHGTTITCTLCTNHAYVRLHRTTHTLHAYYIHSILQSSIGKLWPCLLHQGRWQSMTKLGLTMVLMCSRSPGRAMTTFTIHSPQQPLVCAETTWVSRCFPLPPSADTAVILTRDIPTTSGTRVASETQTVRWQEQRRDIHGFWDQTGRTLMRMVLSWRADSGLVLSVMELDRIKLATDI